MGKIKDLTGYEFQTWKVLKLSSRKAKGNNVYWLCECQVCHQQKELCGTEIRLGRTGACRHTKKKENNYLKTNQSNSLKIKDETNKRYGKLLVISFAYTKDSKAYWNCQCDCGNKIVVKGSSLRNKETESCGCLKSRKEEEVKSILENNAINFVR